MTQHLVGDSIGTLGLPKLCPVEHSLQFGHCEWAARATASTLAAGLDRIECSPLITLVLFADIKPRHAGILLTPAIAFASSVFSNLPPAASIGAPECDVDFPSILRITLKTLLGFVLGSSSPTYSFQQSRFILLNSFVDCLTAALYSARLASSAVACSCRFCRCDASSSALLFHNGFASTREPFGIASLAANKTAQENCLYIVSKGAVRSILDSRSSVSCQNSPQSALL